MGRVAMQLVAQDLHLTEVHHDCTDCYILALPVIITENPETMKLAYLGDF